MKLTKQEAFVVGVVLALLEAGQQMIHVGSWHAYISMAIIMIGAIGVRAISAAQFAAEVPPGVITALTAAIGALDVFQHEVLTIPRGVHAVIGAIIVLASTLGIREAAPAPAVMPPVPVAPAPPNV